MSTIIDEGKRTVTVDGKPILLTKTEFAIIEYLSANPGMHRSRAQIMDAAEISLESDDRNVDVHVKRLRKKGVKEIGTSSGIGYYWTANIRASTQEIREMRRAERLCHDLSDHLIRAGGAQAVLIAANIPQSLLDLFDHAAPTERIFA